VADHESPELVASFFTLSGAGFGEPARNSFVERCEAAATAGFTGVGVHADDLPRTIAAGLGIGEIQAVLRINGLSVVELEFLGGWALPPAETPASTTDPSPAPYLKTLDRIEAVADSLGGRHVSAGEFRGDAELDAGAASGRLREVSDRLAAHDLLVAVEPFPWSAISTIAIATDLIRQSGATNVGLMIDVWHFFNSGAELSVLDHLPGAGVAAFQLNDGPLVHEDFLINARATRKLPGQGDLDVVGLIRAARGSGFAGPWCVEVNTPEFRALPVDEAARQAADSATEVLRAAMV
jgi:sugar phosphate isomerase/epimerase